MTDTPAQPDPNEPANGLEELLQQAATTGDPGDGTRFVEKLMESVVGVAGVPTDDGAFQPLVVGTPDGPIRHVLGFTAPHRLDIAKQQLGLDAAVEARGRAVRDLFAELVSHNLGLLLNHRAGFGKEFTVPEMSDLLAGVDPGSRERTVDEGIEVQVGEPAQVPDGLIDRLRAHLTAVPDVRRAALGWIRYPDGLEGYLLEVHAGSPRETVLAGLDQAIGSIAPRTLDVLCKSPDEDALTASVPAFMH